MEPIDNKTILIVEDEEFSSEFLKQLLSLRNFEYREVKDGLSAVNMIKRDKSIKLVLMDIMLPILSGTDAMHEIKKLRPEIPVIAQTAQAMKGDKEKFIQQGFDDYVSKPIQVDLILAKIDRFFNTEINYQYLSN